MVDDDGGGGGLVVGQWCDFFFSVIFFIAREREWEKSATIKYIYSRKKMFQNKNELIQSKTNEIQFD